MRPFQSVILLGILSWTFKVFGVGYDHEFYASLQINQGSGEVNANSTKKKITDSATDMSIGYGYFLGPIIEPFFEYSLVSETADVGDFSQSNTRSGWSIGLLYNIPTEQTRKKKGKEKEKEKKKSGSWLSYGGFLITSTTRSGSGGNTSKIKLSKGTITTKLIFGTRYLLFANVAINSWLRLAYENTKDSASAPDEEAAGVSKLSWELRLFSLSVLF